MIALCKVDCDIYSADCRGLARSLSHSDLFLEWAFCRAFGLVN
jgi:hypothetical protein